MGHAAIRKVAVDLPSEFLPGANWADAYEFSHLSQILNATEAAKTMFESPPPRWVRALNALRNKIVGIFGIKPGQITIAEGQDGAFPRLSQSQDAAVYGFDDWHLNFRIVIEVRDRDAGHAVRLTTLVRRNNGFGHVYIFLISPFHRLIVRRLLRNLP